MSVIERERIYVIDTEGEAGISCGFHFLTFGVIIYLGLTYLLCFFYSVLQLFYFIIINMYLIRLYF
jgi:hypothetical protein